MNTADAVKMILFRIGQPGNSALEEVIQLEMENVVRNRLERSAFMPWFLLSDRMCGYTLSGDSRIALPPDFLMEYEEGELMLRHPDGRWMALDKKELNEVKQLEGPFPPRFYSLVGEFIRISPAPDQVYAVRMIYYARKPLEYWLEMAGDWVIAATAVQVASGQQYLEKVAECQAEEQRAEARIHRYHQARQYAKQDLWMEPVI